MALKTSVEKLKMDVELQHKEIESKNAYIQVNMLLLLLGKLIVLISNKSLEANIDDLKNSLNLSQELINEFRVKEEDYKKKYARLEEVAKIFIILRI